MTSLIGQAALQRATNFLGSVTYTRSAELGIPVEFASHPVNQGGLCASFVASVLSQVGFPHLSLTLQPLMAMPDVLRAALVASGFVPMPVGSLAPPGSVVIWPHNEHAAFLLRTDGQTMTVLNSNSAHRALPQTVRFDNHLVAYEQRATIFRPPL
ncbi:MAG: hypothetical protein ACAI38_01055 [Myxococcota bacterium]